MTDESDTEGRQCSEMGCSDLATKTLDGPNRKMKLPVCEFHYTPESGEWVKYD